MLVVTACRVAEARFVPRVFQIVRYKNLSIPRDKRSPCTNISVPYVFVGDEVYPLFDKSLKTYCGENLDPYAVYFNKQLPNLVKKLSLSLAYCILMAYVETTEKNSRQNCESRMYLAKCDYWKGMSGRPFERHCLIRGRNVSLLPEQNTGRNIQTAKKIRDALRVFFLAVQLELFACKLHYK